MLRIDHLEAIALEVPLRDPFVIASGRIEVTRAVLVRATVRDEHSGRRATGYGEAAALPPITHEDQPDLFDSVRRFAATAVGHTLDEPLDAWLDSHEVLGLAAQRPVARAGVETALLDACARLAAKPLYATLATGHTPVGTWSTDITIPMHAPAYMGDLAAAWRAQGFRCFKVKVGIDRVTDLAALRAIVARVPDATFRIDANGGYGARDALGLYADAVREGCVIECFEQPCARNDDDAMALVTRELPVPVVADESVRDFDDLGRVLDRGLARGVNLKLVKMSGPLRAAALGVQAKKAGLLVMCGAMVETRLGITAAAHVCAALGGCDYVDLDTAWLMREDPFVGGYHGEGPVMSVSERPGLAIELRAENGGS